MSKKKGYGIDIYAHYPEADFVAATKRIKNHIRSLALENGLTSSQAGEMAESTVNFSAKMHQIS